MRFFIKIFSKHQNGTWRFDIQEYIKSVANYKIKQPNAVSPVRPINMYLKHGDESNTQLKHELVRLLVFVCPTIDELHFPISCEIIHI